MKLKILATLRRQQSSAVKGSRSSASLIQAGRCRRQRKAPPTWDQTMVRSSGESGPSLISTLANYFNSTTAKLDLGRDGNHGRCQSVLHRNRGRHSPRRYSVSLDERSGTSTRRAKRKPWTEAEKLFCENVLRMDELTKHERVGYVVCRSPSRIMAGTLADRHRCTSADSREGVAKSMNLNSSLKPSGMRQAKLNMKLA
jgi:hypothetical protein